MNYYLDVVMRNLLQPDILDIVAMDNNNRDIMFDKIKQFLRKYPFVSFTLRSRNKDINVTHPNAIAFHPEVPFITIYDKTEIYDVPVDSIAFVERQHVH